MNPFKRFAHVFDFVYILVITLITACSSSKDIRRIPTPLADIHPVLEVKQVWKVRVGQANRYLFQPIVDGGSVYAAAADGSIVKIDANSGRRLWHKKLRSSLSAGVGSDGQFIAVGDSKGGVTLLNADGALLWQANVNGEILTPPLVGYRRVLVRTIDGRISAFDAKTGEQQWVFRNHAVALNLRASFGMLFATPQAIIAGFPGGTLAALHLLTGDAFWQTPVSYPNGVTEVERINDITGTPTLIGRVTCAVTFQGHIGCFDAETGQAIWKHSFSSYGGLAQDESTLVAANDWSVISLYDSMTGELRWHNAALQGRNVGTPAIVGEAVVLGDYQGFVHFFARKNGEIVARIHTDHHAITAQPVLAGQTLVVQTQGGWLYGLQPQ